MAPTHVGLAGEQSVCAPKVEQSKLPVFKVTKPGVKRNTKKLPRGLQRPLPPTNKTFAVKIQADGLLDINNAPTYLMVAMKRNSTKSPLLRLDKNIRSKIWECAMGRQTIEIRARKMQATGDVDSIISATDIGPAYIGKVAHDGPKRTQPKTAFRLPEVCRQIYAETATLGYTINQFAFVGEVAAKFGRVDGPDGALEGWCRELIPAQINAVTSIRPHWHDLQYYLSKGSMSAFKQLFPRLKQLRVPSRAVNCDAKWPSRGDPMRRHLRQQAKERIAAMIKKQEGQDIEVVFSTT